MIFDWFFTQWHFLDRWQRRISSKIISTLVLLSIVLVSGLPMLSAVLEFEEARFELREAVSGDEGQALALALQATGQVVVGDRNYEDLRLIDAPILNSEGVVGEPEELVRILLTPKIPKWVPIWILANSLLAKIVVFGVAVWCICIVWIGLFVPFIFVSLVTVLFAFVGGEIWGRAAVVSIGGVGGIGFTYILLVRLTLLMFSSRGQVLTIAGNLIREANRTRLPLFFIAALLLVLPFLPLTLDSDSPLRYQLQTFISRGVTLTFTLAGVMTLLLACSTIAFEIRDRQVWHLFTKPLSYSSYLFGKWIGIITLNAMLFLVGGLSVFLYVQYLRTQPVVAGESGVYDRLAIEQEVLVARKTTYPIYQALTGEQLSVRIQDMIDRDPELSRMERIPVGVRREFQKELQEAFVTTQRSVPPSVGENLGARTVLFTGLSEAKRLGHPLTFRYLFYIRSADEHEVHRLGIMFNQDPSTMRTITYVPTVASVQKIPSSFVREDGSVLITLVNLYDQQTAKSSMTWDPDGVQMLYTVGGFEGNFFRASLLLWLEISALGAIALAAATAFGFPVALLTAFTVFGASQVIPFLVDSLRYVNPEPFDWSNLGQVFESVFDRFSSFIGEITVFVFSAFGKFQPTDSLVDGLLVSWSEVGGALFSFIILWGGVVLFLGYIVLSRRQLAIYSGNG